MNIRHFFSSLLLLSILVFHPCFSRQHASGQKAVNTQHHVIVILGASIATGAGAHPADSGWAFLFKHYLAAKSPASTVINLAVGGYKTYQGMPSHFHAPQNRPAPDTAHNITKAMSYHPTDIIISYPGNDITAGFSVQEVLKNLDTLYSYRKHGIAVWIATTAPRIAEARQRACLYELKNSILQRYGRHAINFYDGFATADGYLEKRYDSGDGLHPNNAGHQKLFERVVEANILQP